MDRERRVVDKVLKCFASRLRLAVVSGLIGLLATVVFSAATLQASAAEAAVRLLMFEAPACPHCKRWHVEIGGIYEKSREGRFAPLERLAISEAARRSVAGVRYSPTFVVLRNGEELGRIVGYSGPDFFWSQLGEVLARAGFEPG
jgi:thioredoxin-related protein